MAEEHFVNREMSWLAFNARVLQEAANTQVPIGDRLRFLAIFSSNLDEFFRVRVASLRSLLRLKRKSVEKLHFDPTRLLSDIHREVEKQQRKFGDIFDSLLPELEKVGIRVVAGRDLDETEVAFARRYFTRIVDELPQPTIIDRDSSQPFLKNRLLYFVTELWSRRDGSTVTASSRVYGILEVPTDRIGRFVVMDDTAGIRHVLFVDDIIRLNTQLLYPDYEVGDTFSVKTTRDAELYLEDEYGGNLVEMIRHSLEKRALGPPTRFLFDGRMPYPMVSMLRDVLDLDEEDLVQGGRYHNFNDFFSFPDDGIEGLRYPPHVPLAGVVIPDGQLVVDRIRERDLVLHLPYHSFDPVVRFFQEASTDPKVKEIFVTLYRVASNSAIVEALIAAAQAGKKVTVFVEVKARFDEARNLRWAAEMEQSGVAVLYSMPGIKVHSKLALVTRIESGKTKRYAYLATGNFNEKTARAYADHALFTCNPEITSDVRKVFQKLSGTVAMPTFKRLLVAPDYLRKEMMRLVEREIEHSLAGRKSGMTLKMNSLEDEQMISLLYRASQSGVRIRLIVRGICRLRPGVAGLSENISVISIVDRFLEHARAFVFENGGNREVYLGSADWMNRNLSRRVEVVFPILDPAIADEIVTILALQLEDSVSARIVDGAGRNKYVPTTASAVRSQVAIFEWIRSRGSAR